MEVVSRIHQDYIVWMTHDDRTGRWRYNLVRLPYVGAVVAGPDETAIVQPFESEAAAWSDAVRHITALNHPARLGRPLH